jgi:pyruvate/2-oxoglutarate dehydrogenase complex dihydrolipoamide acyltransferase (E2) component
VQGPVLQPFSYDEAHPYASGQHRGVDIGADAAGETVVAPAAGTVSYAGTVPTNGKTVTIETADGYSVTLTHLGSIAVTKGATVAEQDVVATIGPSGTPEVDGPYVHLGIRVATDPNGYVDPLGLLPPASGSTATQTSTTASQPVSSGVSAPVPASKPAPSAPRKPRVASARGTRAEPVRSQVRVHHRERGQNPRAHTGRTRVQQRPAVRDRASEPTTSSFRRPIVEPEAPRTSGLDARHEIRPSAYVAPPRRKPSSPLLALVCNWAAALFALSAAFAARRRRSNTSPTARAQVLHLPLPEDELRQVSRAA